MHTPPVPPRVVLAAAAVVLLGAGLRCTLPSASDALGFSCRQDSDCGDSTLLVCRAGVCSARSSEPGGDAGVSPLPEAPFPIRAAAFVLEFPYAFKYGTFFHPVLGPYDSTDAGVVAAQVDDLVYGNVDAVLAQWWGNGTPSDQSFARLLHLAAGKNLRWGLAYAGETPATPLTLKAAGLLLSDATQKYGASPNFFRIRGKSVLYVRAAVNSDPCDVASRYVAGNQQYNGGRTFLILRAKTGKAVTDCAQQPDAWMLDDDAKAVQSTPQVVNLQPGAVSGDGGSPFLARNLARFASSLHIAQDAGVQLQVISSFNAWYDGTSVEPATEYASDSGYGTFLDAMHATPPRP